MPAHMLLLPGNGLPFPCPPPASLSLCFSCLPSAKGTEPQRRSGGEAALGRTGGAGVSVRRVPVTQTRASGSCQCEAGSQGNL